MVNGVDFKRIAEGRVGTVLRDRWRLDAVLGVGGMGAVYAATHRNRKRVAIKMLHPYLAADATVTRRFSREGYIANSVGHPGAVTIDDDDVDADGTPFLVMELLTGETLDRRLRRSNLRLPAGEAVAFTRRLLAVLEAAHRAGVVHRDVKPENLFYTDAGQLKVLDFGLAQARELPASAAASLTHSQSLLGTPFYMAPEQALGRWELVDGATDLWAAGAVLFLMLTGRHVHEGRSAQEVLVRAATEHAPPLGSIAPDLPHGLADVVDRALAYSKHDRWPGARAMLDALDALGLPDQAPAVVAPASPASGPPSSAARAPASPPPAPSAPSLPSLDDAPQPPGHVDASSLASRLDAPTLASRLDAPASRLGEPPRPDRAPPAAGASSPPAAGTESAGSLSTVVSGAPATPTLASAPWGDPPAGQAPRAGGGRPALLGVAAAALLGVTAWRLLLPGPAEAPAAGAARAPGEVDAPAAIQAAASPPASVLAASVPAASAPAASAPASAAAPGVTAAAASRGALVAGAASREQAAASAARPAPMARASASPAGAAPPGSPGPVAPAATATTNPLDLRR